MVLEPKRDEPKIPEPSPNKADSNDPLQSSAPTVDTKPAVVKKMPINIGINPLAMMPGATPPGKEPAPQAVGFDIPAQNANVLSSMNKVHKLILYRLITIIDRTC